LKRSPQIIHPLPLRQLSQQDNQANLINTINRMAQMARAGELTALAYVVKIGNTVQPLSVAGEFTLDPRPAHTEFDKSQA
jgi:hypothetical protein